ncbi:MAG: sucrase ferredoxin [Anaerolineae bacterium]
MADTAFLCSELTREAGTQQFGSAQIAKLWFLIEYPRPYGAQAIEDFWRDEFAGVDHTPLSAYPASRFQLIKRKESEQKADFTLFAAVADELQPRLYEFRLHTYHDLLTLDVPALLAGDAKYDSARRDTPLYLVCTNGKRDQCCAKHGVAFYHEVLKRAGEAAWESSHIGGHRFAATMIVFPYALYYGQVSAAEVQTIIELTERGSVYYEKMRGRACYTREAQVAEYYLRDATGVRALAAFKLLHITRNEDSVWTARFQALESALVHRVEFEQSDSSWEVYASCADAAPKRDFVYRLLHHGVEE